MYGICLTSDQRAKWMNDSCTSVVVSFGARLVTKNRTGRKIFPHHLIVEKTVIEIACPSMLREAVPVAVIGPAEVAVLTTSNVCASP